MASASTASANKNPYANTVRLSAGGDVDHQSFQSTRMIRIGAYHGDYGALDKSSNYKHLQAAMLDYNGLSFGGGYYTGNAYYSTGIQTVTDNNKAIHTFQPNNMVFLDGFLIGFHETERLS